MTCGVIERKCEETAVRYGLYIVRMSLHQEKELKTSGKDGVRKCELTSIWQCVVRFMLR